jgi:phage shock protein PspC (stress-responsive transcriptional regulator)
MNPDTPEGEPRHSENPSSSGDGSRPPLVRSREDRFIGGVAAGLGRYFGVDATFVRIAFLVSLVIGGVGVLAYLVLLAAMPMEGDPREPVPPVTGSRRNLVISATVMLGLLLIIAAASGGSGTLWLFGFGFGTVFGILLWVFVAAALGWTVRVARDGSSRAAYAGATAASAGGDRPVPASGASARGAPTPARPLATAAESPGSPPPSDASTAETAVFAESPSQTAPSGAATEVMPEPPRTGPGAPATFGRVMTWVAIGLAALVGFIVIAGISFGLTAAFGAIPAAAAVMVCGVAIVWLALAGRPALSIWLVGAAVAIAIPMGVVTIAGLDVEGDWGDVRHSPRSAAAIPDDGYKLAAGAMRIDLRDFPFRRGVPVTLPSSSGFGATEVIVPDDVCVIGAVEGDIGFIDMRGEESSGADPESRTDRAVAGLRVLRLDSEFKLGYFGVRDATSRQVDRLNSDESDWSTERDESEQAAARERAEAACTPNAGRDRRKAGNPPA